MRLLPFLLFIAVPLAEIAVFIKVGEIIGLLWTVLLVILTAIVGVALLKRQGLATLARAQEALDAGRLPVDSVLDGVCLLVAGAFLLTPGLITDTAGFLLLVPAFRRGLARWAFDKLSKHGSIQVKTFGGGAAPGAGPSRGGEGPVIDGDYVRVDEQDEAPKSDKPTKTGKKPDRRSPWSG
ncbi:MAG: FxsA family protein [Methyloligellaceae bacterium]